MTFRKPVRVIGLTGGIATGKSSVARMFEEHGAVVIDADQLSREAVMPGTDGLARIVATFGDNVLLADGTLDRASLRKIIFSDREKRRQLEQILHPEIKRLAEEQIAAASADNKELVFYMAPLLIEAGATERVDEIWVVTVQPAVQLERLMARDGINVEQAQAIIKSQMPLADKELYGRIVIDNSGTLEQTRQIVNTIWKQETGKFHE